VSAEKVYPSGACLLRFSRPRAAGDRERPRRWAQLTWVAVFATETDSYANERLPETWTPTAEVVNSRVASARPLRRSRRSRATAAHARFTPHAGMPKRSPEAAPTQWLRSSCCSSRS